MKARSQFVIVLVVVAAILSVSIVAGFQHYKETVAESHEADVEQSARQVRSELDGQLAAHKQTVELIATHPDIAAHSEPAQRRVLKTVVNETAFSGMSVIAANGTMTGIVAGLSDQRRQTLTGQDFSDRTYVQRALDGETYVSEPIEADSGNYIVTVSAPIRHDGEIVGTLNGAFHLSERSFFAPAIASYNATTGITVRSDAGHVIYAKRASPDTDLVVRNATLRETNWQVSVSESQSVIRSQQRTTTALQFGSVLAVLASIAGFGWWNYRRNLTQVEALLEGFDALENRAYGTQIDIGGAEEWDRIGTGFNEMSRTVEQYFTGREQRTHQLQILDRLLRHNLRNDMNVVLGQAETIVAKGSPTMAEHARQIIETSDGLLAQVEKERTLNDVLQEGQAPAPVSVNTAVQHAVARVRAEYPGATITLDCPDDVTALAIPHIETAIGELIENAVDHTDRESAAVAVTVTAEPSTARIEIADNGPGIPEIERRLLTDSQDIDPLNHSQGLGLWLVYWIVSHSEGTLAFAENDPRGSTVILELPRPDDDAE